nr:MAG TPA: hypothetical protein [Caudoviricetes sp.]
MLQHYILYTSLEYIRSLMNCCMSPCRLDYIFTFNFTC